MFVCMNKNYIRAKCVTNIRQSKCWHATERHIRRLLLTLRSTILRATEEQIFLDASDLFSSPGGFCPPVEARIQKGFVVRLVSGARSEPGLLLSAVRGRKRTFTKCNIFKAALINI